jgi:hypothetical protein
MKLRRAGTVKRLNVEHRTSNIEHRILMTLRFIYFKTIEPQNPPKADKFRSVDSLSSVFSKIDRSTQRLTTGRTHYFDPPLEDSLFHSFFFDLTGTGPVS